MSGSIIGNDSVNTTTLSGLFLNQSGNDNTQEFSTNSYNFAHDKTDSGGILVTGANNTKPRGRINNIGIVAIEYYDGSGTFV